MKRKAAETWQDVVVGKATRCDGSDMGVICLKGGLCPRQEGAVGFALHCEQRDLPDLPAAFVPVAKNRMWVLKVVGGGTAVKGGLQATTLCNQVHAKLREGDGDVLLEHGTPRKEAPAAAGASPGGSAAAEAEAQDPMAALLGSVQGASKGQKQGPSRDDPLRTPQKRQGFPRRTVARVTVPMSPKPGEVDTKQVVVYENRAGVLCVHCEDLPWFLQYLHEETTGASVPEPGPEEESDDALDERHPWTTRWCPSGAWTVTVKGGPLACKTWSSRLQDLTAEKWARGAALSGVTTAFEKATRPEQKAVLRSFLEDVVEKEMAQEAEK